MTPVLGNILQPLIDFFHWFLEFFHDSLGLGWGTAIVALTVLRAGDPAAGHLQVVEVDDPAAAARAGDEVAADEVQAGPAAAPAGDDEVLPGEPGQPVRVLPPDDRPAAGVPGAVLHAARRPPATTSARTINPPGTPNPQPCGETPESSFLFIPDLTDKATGAVLVALIVLYVGSQLVSTLLMSATADKNQRRIFLALPFLFVAFIWQFPAGLLVYWITTNLWTILQQSIIKKRLGPLREEAMAAAKAAKEEQEAEKGKGEGRQGQGRGRQAARSGSSRRRRDRRQAAAAARQAARQRPAARRRRARRRSARGAAGDNATPPRPSASASCSSTSTRRSPSTRASRSSSPRRASSARRSTPTTSASSSAATAPPSTPSSTSPTASPPPPTTARSA